jgi:hypothetical protein
MVIFQQDLQIEDDAFVNTVMRSAAVEHSAGYENHISRIIGFAVVFECELKLA